MLSRRKSAAGQICPRLSPTDIWSRMLHEKMLSPMIARRLARLRTRDGRQVLIAASALAWVNLALKILPFNRAITIGSMRIRQRRGLNQDRVREWAAAVSRAARLVPWRAVCIHQGLALQWLLRKRGVPAILFYGTKFEDGELTAHVWVKVGERVVIGEEGSTHFHVMTSFPSESE